MTPVELCITLSSSFVWGRGVQVVLSSYLEVLLRRRALRLRWKLKRFENAPHVMLLAAVMQRDTEDRPSTLLQVQANL